MKTPDVLIIDDDADVRRTLALLLDKKYSVVEAASGKAALKFLKDARPRLVLLDVSMPEMSGIEVLRTARQMDKSLRVVMLTSHQELEIAKSALDLGAIAYVTKPFEPDFIRAEVARLLAPAGGADRSGRPWVVKE